MAKRLSESAFGTWVVDDYAMPAIDLRADKLLAAHPVPAHALGTGRIGARLDGIGRLTIRDMRAPPPPYPSERPAGFCSAFYLRLSSGDESRVFFMSNLAPEETPAVQWGVCHATYAAELTLAGQSLAVKLTFVAPVEADYLVVEAELTNGSKQSITLETLAVSDVPPPVTNPHEWSRPIPFCHGNVAMLTECDEAKQDFFLAAGKDWEVEACDARLRARCRMDIAAGDRVAAKFLVGLRRDCTVAWVNEMLTTSSPEGIRKDWAACLELTFPRFPEAWIREECVWDVSRLLASRKTCRREGARGNDETYQVVSTIPRPAETPASVRNLLRLSLPVAYVNPELARGNLLLVTRRMQTSGRIGNSARVGFRPESDVCDLEIWLILAWCHLIQLTGDLPAGVELEPPAGQTLALQAVLEQAFSWIETEIGTGARGLLRCGAGDGLGLLTRMGRHGCGESTVATAMLAYALDLWQALEPQMTDRPTGVSERVRRWLPLLKGAVSDSFRNGVFVRGFDDDGNPVGGNAPGDPWYLDAQVWPLLAGCGTATQREAVLSTLIKTARKGALPAISQAYELPEPPSVCCFGDLPGTGLNGGVDCFSWACAVWAMAEAGAREDALRQWRRLCLRQLMVDRGISPSMNTEVTGTVPSYLVRSGSQGSTLIGTGPPLDTDWLNWHHFAICKILT